MEKPVQSAWLPLTPRRVAAFAGAKIGRLCLVQFVVAMVAAALIGWFVNRAWFSVVGEAIRQFPAQGQIRFGRLHWPDESPKLLAEGRFLAISVDGENSDAIRSPAHVQLELRRDDFSVHSLFGYREGDYPTGWIFQFNRTQLEPKFGAWRPVLVAGVIGLTLVLLMINWSLLATLYFFPTWLIGFFLNRDLNFRSSWKLAGAALMPGALFLTAAIFVYAVGLLDLPQLCVAFGLHFVIGWIYLGIAPVFSTKNSNAVARKNPFA